RLLTDRSSSQSGYTRRRPSMATAVIVDAVRTAGGKRNGKLSGWHPADLAGEVLRALGERNDLDPALIEDVITGCVMQIGPQGISAELIADKWGLSREELDAFGARSQQLAVQATEEGRFEREIIAVTTKTRDKESGKIIESDELVTRDEGLRPGTTVETLANLKPAFKPDGRVTAGNSSQITDGASAALIMSEEKAASLGLRPRARFHAFSLAGVDPVTMLTGPIPATGKVLERAGLK